MSLDVATNAMAQQASHDLSAIEPDRPPGLAGINVFRSRNPALDEMPDVLRRDDALTLASKGGIAPTAAAAAGSGGTPRFNQDQVLLQAGVLMLAQAHRVPRYALSLLS
jgi:hypothetical protein